MKCCSPESFERNAHLQVLTDFSITVALHTITFPLPRLLEFCSWQDRTVWQPWLKVQLVTESDQETGVFLLTKISAWMPSNCSPIFTISKSETGWAAGGRHCFWSRLISIDKMLRSNGIPLCHYGDLADMDTCELTSACSRVATAKALIRVREEGARERRA